MLGQKISEFSPHRQTSSKKNQLMCYNVVMKNHKLGTGMAETVNQNVPTAHLNARKEGIEDD